jgi:hypothetical protein
MNTLPFLGSGYTGVLVQPLTLQAGGSAPAINFDRLFRVEAYNGGSRLWYRTVSQEIGSFDVTETPAAIAALFPIILLTQVVGTVTNPAYYPIGLLSEPQTSGSGATINIFHGFNGTPETITVSETKAAIIAAIEAAAAIAGGGGGGSSQTLVALGTNQGTAAQVTARNVRIDSASSAGTGIILDTATAGEAHFIYNASNKAIAIYPAVGEFIDPELVNQPILLGAYESLYLASTLAGRWSATIAVSSLQSVTPSGIVQGGGQIREGVTQAIVTGSAAGNTAVTLPTATAGARINVNNIGGSAPLRLFPSGTNQINAGGAGVMTNLHADSSIDLMCSSDGLWVDVTTYIKNLFTEGIAAKLTGGTVSISDASANPIAQFSTQVELFKGLQLLYAEGPSRVGGGQGGTFISANIFNCTTCATLGDSLTFEGGSNFYWVTNSGVAPLYVYCNSTSQMNGVLNGYAIVAPGQVMQFNAVTEPASVPIWTSSLLYSPAGEYTALAGTPPHLVHPYATLTTVAAPLAEVILDDQQQSVVLVNAGANTALLLPPAGDTLNGAASLQLPVRSIVHAQKSAANVWTMTYSSFGAQSGTAFAGGGQASGTKIIGPAVDATTVASAGDSFTIAFESPRMIYFSNNGANACDVFPTSGGTINGGAANAAISVAVGAEYIFYSNDMFTWLAILQ